MIRRNARTTAICILLAIFMLVFYIQSSHAVREGTLNANIMIKCYERDGDFAKAALWREAAAGCLEIISMPMTEIQIRYYILHGKDALVETRRRELADIKAQREYHLQRAKANWEKSITNPAKRELAAEHEKIAQFIATWAPTYPDRFYDYGVYPNFFKKQQQIFKRKGDYAAALNLEADGAEMCADQYNEITVAYFRWEAERSANAGQTNVAELYRQRAAQYEKVRDAHRWRAALLRALAERKPKTWPPGADRKEIELLETKTELTPEQASQIANADPRIQRILKGHKGVHEYAWFQGFAWTVSYYNHGWGNLAIAIVDDKTGQITDVLNSIENLEAREWDESAGRESGKLRLDPRQVKGIARKYDEISSYFTESLLKAFLIRKHYQVKKSLNIRPTCIQFADSPCEEGSLGIIGGPPVCRPLIKTGDFRLSFRDPRLEPIHDIFICRQRFHRVREVLWGNAEKLKQVSIMD